MSTSGDSGINISHTVGFGSAKNSKNMAQTKCTCPRWTPQNFAPLYSAHALTERSRAGYSAYCSQFDRTRGLILPDLGIGICAGLHTEPCCGVGGVGTFRLQSGADQGGHQGRLARCEEHHGRRLSGAGCRGVRGCRCHALASTYRQGADPLLLITLITHSYPSPPQCTLLKRTPPFSTPTHHSISLLTVLHPTLPFPTPLRLASPY